MRQAALRYLVFIYTVFATLLLYEFLVPAF